MNRRNILIILSILSFIIIIGGISYSYFVYNKDVGTVSLTAGEISIDFSGVNGNQTMSNVVPLSDFDGMSSSTYFDFSVNATVDTERIYYEVYIMPDNGNTLDTRYLKTYLTDQSNNEIKGITVYSDLGNSEIENGKVIYKGIIEVNNNGTTRNETKAFRLRLWLDENYYSQTSQTFDFDIYLYAKNVDSEFELPYGHNLVRNAILAKQNATTNSCNPIWTDTDDIQYFSGTNDCVDMNYVWYSGKLWRITSIYSDGSMKLVTENSLTTLSFNEDGNNVFYTNATTTSYVYQWLSEDFYDSLYYPSNFIDTTKQWNATATSSISTKPGNTTMVSSNVGLINAYEYYNSYRCIESSECEGTSPLNGYLNINYTWTTLTEGSNTNVNLVSSDGQYASGYLISSYAIRPSIIIKSNTEFTGSGTTSNPYKIVGDKRAGKTNELINTRLSGEYVKLKNGSNEQVFRIMGFNDNKTKIIAMNYAENGNTRKISTASGGADSIWGQGATTDPDTWYTYLNNTYYPNLVSIYGNLFDNGLYYLGITTNYYYKNVRSLSDDFIIGLPSYGEMFAAQQAGGVGSSINIWLINRTTGHSNLWGVNSVCGGSNTSPTNLRGARPTLYLKSTVKILSGSGTKTDPYVVGL